MNITRKEARKLACQIHSCGVWEEFGTINWAVVPSRSGLRREVRALADALQVGLESVKGLEEQINSYFAYTETCESRILLTCYQLQTFQRDWSTAGDPWEIRLGEDENLWELLYQEVFGVED